MIQDSKNAAIDSASKMSEAFGGSGDRPTPETNHNQINVLFVEDNMINRKLLTRKMEAKGFTVTTANNGQEAVEAFRAASDVKQTSRAFDCVLMDQEVNSSVEHETCHTLTRHRCLSWTEMLRRGQSAILRRHCLLTVYTSSALPRMSGKSNKRK